MIIKVFTPDGSFSLRCKNCKQDFWVHSVGRAFGPGTELVAICPDQEEEEDKEECPNTL